MSTLLDGLMDTHCGDEDPLFNFVSEVNNSVEVCGVVVQLHQTPLPLHSWYTGNLSLFSVPNVGNVTI